LSCEHTETLISHAQLVTEILEAFVARSGWPSLPEVPWIDPELGSANWDAIVAEAYTTLAGAVYPFTMPYSNGRLYERAYLEKLGLTRYDWLSIFHPGPNHSVAADAEWLHLWPDVTDLVFDRDASTSAARWGFASGTNLVAALDDVDVMLRQTQLSFIELKQLLDTRYVNPNGALSIEGPDPSDLASLTIAGLQEEDLRRIEYFLRLFHVMRRLDDETSLYEVDAVISGAVDEAINLNPSLLGVTDRLRRRLGVGWYDVLTVYLYFETKGPLAPPGWRPCPVPLLWSPSRRAWSPGARSSQ
jgi:hypothetical protein